MDCLSRCLRGDFVDVGALLVYGDHSALDLIQLFLHVLVKKIPMHEMLVSDTWRTSIAFIVMALGDGFGGDHND